MAETKAKENGEPPVAELAEKAKSYTFNVSDLTARICLEFYRERIQNNFDEQYAIMEKFVLTVPEAHKPSLYGKHFFRMRDAYSDAIELNKGESIGYSFDVEFITLPDIKESMRAIATKNIAKLSPLMEKYLDKKPKGVGELDDILWSVYSALISKFMDVILDLSKN